jgi:hypothetical protein
MYLNSFMFCGVFLLIFLFFLSLIRKQMRFQDELNLEKEFN